MDYWRSLVPESTSLMTMDSVMKEGRGIWPEGCDAGSNPVMCISRMPRRDYIVKKVNTSKL